mmetsp:Transcript_15527/g.48823  ORF Transcript_15527/g.48823 Transcript_15527/m.48823 type:complete len:367 (-) Transcript_15527:133-1233(-)
MDVEARVAELGDLLGEELHAVHRVTEDDRLVHLELGEEGVKAVHLLLLLDECIELRDTLERELVHEVDDIGLLQELVLEILDRHRECGGVAEDLPGRGQEVEELLDERLELGREELVRLVHDSDVTLSQLRHTLVGQVEDAAGGGDDHVHGAVEAHDVVLEGGASRGHHHFHAQVLAELLAHLRRLQGELAGGHEEESLDLLLLHVDLLHDRDAERGGLASTVLRAREDVAPGEGDGDRLLLDRRGTLEALLVNPHKQLPFEEVILEFVTLGGSHVLRPVPIISLREIDALLPLGLGAGSMRRDGARVGSHEHLRWHMLRVGLLARHRGHGSPRHPRMVVSHAGVRHLMLHVRRNRHDASPSSRDH